MRGEGEGRGKERESEGKRGLTAGEMVTNKSDYLPLIIKGERERRDRGRMGEREGGGEGDRKVEKTQVHIFIIMYRTTVAMVIRGHAVNPETSRHTTCTYIPLLGVSMSQLSTAPKPPREHSPCNCKHRTGQW